VRKLGAHRQGQGRVLTGAAAKSLKPLASADA
jgi:hypothetical protein